jgi:4-aminobutyrate aminotransferase-like enzyme
MLARCAELGLLVLSCGHAHQVIRFVAPLDVTAAEIAEGVEIFGEALRTV